MRSNQQLYTEMSEIIDTYKEEIIENDLSDDDISYDEDTEDNYLRCFIEVLCAKYVDTFGQTELRDMLNSIMEDMEEELISNLN
jgi:hypothetical protein